MNVTSPRPIPTCLAVEKIKRIQICISNLISISVPTCGVFIEIVIVLSTDIVLQDDGITGGSGRQEHFQSGGKLQCKSCQNGKPKVASGRYTYTL